MHINRSFVVEPGRQGIRGPAQFQWPFVPVAEVNHSAGVPRPLDRARRPGEVLVARGDGGEATRMPFILCDGLEMLVTGDPVAEIDTALVQASANLRAARDAGDEPAGARLAAWIDRRLDQRLTFEEP